MRLGSGRSIEPIKPTRANPGIRDFTLTLLLEALHQLTDPNKQIAPDQLEQAIGTDVLATLSQQTRLSREDLLARLSTMLPEAVDKYTPDGRLPDATDLSRS